jgi:hypothetical protein
MNYINIDNKRKVKYKINKKTNCWEVENQKGISWDKWGYPKISFAGQARLLHRIIFSLYEDNNINSSIIIRHTCDNTQCINPEHLIKGTHQDNVDDRVLRGRSAIGINNGRSKLNEKQVKEIRNSNDKTKFLANKYKVDTRAIYAIRNFLTWKHVK